MTKRNLTLGSASGKLGSVVYMRRRGQQIARLLVSSPHDPRTISQCAQRACFANYVALWRSLAASVGDTWRGVSRYGSPQNAFYVHNRSLMPPIPRSWSRVGAAVPSSGLVTYGSLPVILPYEWYDGTGISGGEPFQGVYLPTSTGTGSIEDATDLIRLFNQCGAAVKEGDIVHIVGIIYYDKLGQNEIADGPNRQPIILHNSMELTLAYPTSVSTSLSDFTFSTGLYKGNQRKTLIRLASNYYAAQGSSEVMWDAIAIYFERPSNPSHSRFSRSRFAIHAAWAQMIKTWSAGGQYYEQVARTYQNI